MRHVDGAPIGTRGGISVVHTFPADGDYVVKMSLHNEPLGGIYGRTTMATMDIKEQVEVSVNGERAALLDLNPRMSETDPKNSLDAQDAADSHHRRPAARLRRVHPALRRPGRRPARAAREHAGRRATSASASRRCRTCATSTILGPSTRHRRVGHAEPPADLHLPADHRRPKKRRCAARDRQAARDAGVSRRRRRRTTSQDADDVLRAGRARSGDFESGIRLALAGDSGRARASCSASSRRRRADARVKAATPTASAISDLASRLSFFLWGTAPDAELLKAADARHAAHARGAREAGARACSPIRAPRRCRRASRRSGCGCRTRQDASRRPALSRLRRHARARRCAARPSCSSTASSARIAACSTCSRADYTFVNERLAQALRHSRTSPAPSSAACTLPGVPPRPARPGQHPDADVGRRSHLAGAARQVGDGSAARHRRRRRRRRTCRRSTTTKADDGGKLLTTRERMEEHRKNPACTSCHRVIDPIGLALENFDVDRRVAHQGQRVPVDSVGDALRRHEDGRARRACGRRC